jgi:hypothetical protein
MVDPLAEKMAAMTAALSVESSAVTRVGTWAARKAAWTAEH